MASPFDTKHNNFGPLRLLLAISVVVSHSFFLTTGITANEPLYTWTGQTLGQHAVEAFFVISGVLIAGSLARSLSLGDFALARAARILPALLVCVLVTALVVGPVFSSLPLLAYFTHGDSWTYIVRTASMLTGNAHLPGVFENVPVTRAINVPLYTLKYEVGCYAVLALAAALGAFRNRTAMTILGAAVLVGYALQQVLHIPGWEGAASLWPRFLACFALGVLAWLWRDRFLPHARHVLLVVGCYALTLGTEMQWLLGPVATAALVLWAASWQWTALQRITAHTDLSYGVYVWGWVVQQGVIALVPGVTVWLHIALSLAVLLPIAWLSWFCVEAPALAWAKRMIAKGGQAKPEPQFRTVPSQD